MPATLTLLGAPMFEPGDGTPPVALPLERRSQLIVLLALRRAWVGRAELAAMLWPDQADKLAFTNLRKTLFRLQGQALGGLLEAQGASLRVDAATDVQAFENAQRERRLADALALYRGPLLAGFDDDANDAWTGWLRFERDRLHALWRGVVLARLDDPQLDAGDGLALAGRLLDADPLDEAALRAQLVLLAGSGQQPRARQAWREFTERLRDELGLAPSAELQALHDSIASAGRPGPAAPARPQAPPGGAADEGFVGRAAERRHIATLLARDDLRLLTITGPGGIGKTRLAERALHELAGTFADGAHFVRLEDTGDAAEMLARLAHATGTPLRGSGSALDQLCRALHEREALLVLDNLEQLVDAAPAVLDPLLAACPRLKLLATSRVRLGLSAEHLLPLEGLPCPEREDADRLEAFDAARLFVAAARRVEPALLPAGEAAAIVDICRQVDGLPLALELAAAWTRVLSCEAIAAELREGTALLHAQDASHPPRHASIELVFEQSWRRLVPAERDALACLSVFQGGFSAEAARAVAGARWPVLGALADKSLLRKDGARLALHPLVQQLAAARMDPVALAQARRAHADWFHRLLAELAPDADAGRRAALEAIEADFDNCMQAWRHAVVHGDPAAVRAATHVLLRLLVRRGRYEEALTMLRQATGAPPLRSDARTQAWLRARAAHCLDRLDRHAEAITEAERALAEPEADPATLLRAHVAVGHSLLRQGQPALALERFERAFAIADDNGEPFEAAAAINQQAMAHQDLGHDERALALLHDALARYRALGHAEGLAIVLTSIGALYHSRGDPVAAEPYLLEAIGLCEREGLTGPLQYALANLGEIDLILGRLDAGRRHAARTLALARADGRRLMALSAAVLEARFALRLGDVDAGRAALVDAAQTAVGFADSPVAWINTLILFADLLRTQGEAAAADRVLGFAAEHPALGPGWRGEVLVERRRAGLPERCALAWPGLALEELLQRVIAEAPIAHAPLIALLRPPANRG